MMNNKPYYAVIFTNKQSKDLEGYTEMAQQMEALAKQQKGFLGIEHARENLGITISYWESLEDIKTWKANTEHQLAQDKGKSQWYNWYKVRICKVEHEYEFFQEQ